ncbi:MAG: hypothetical protein GX603_04475 [Chloroflexi bacterium]|nr:hypothetical protein [Chloroflexota bacterium]
MNYKNSQYVRVQNLMQNSSVFNGDMGGGVFKKYSYPSILQDENNNLFAPARKTILDYFKQNKISWWNGQLTNHPLSSQVACLNHLFPLREDKQAVLSIIKNIYPDIIDVKPLTTDKFLPAFIQFEAISDDNHLNEVNSIRGSQCTSIDALIYGEGRDGRKILFPIEWKYVEAYGNEDKASGNPGIARIKRYTDLINQSAQLKANDHTICYFEPFYQLMRQTLWAEQLISHRKTETIKADDYIHIHVIPSENGNLLHKIYPYSGKGMEATWRECLNDQSRYVIVTPEELLSPVDWDRYSILFEYLNTRYW